MNPAGRFTVPSTHPALAGHFPGNPVVPGVVLLDHALEEVLAGRTLTGLPAVKFLRPVRPGECVDIICGEPQAGRIAFVCRVGDDDVVRGTAQLGDAP